MKPDGATLSGVRVAALTTLAMLAFAGNSLLCRQALRHTAIDPASFTLVRIVSGAIVLWLIVRSRDARPAVGGRWASALALFAYAAWFSFAYVSLTAATGALLLFGAVQVTMIGAGVARGERLQAPQILGLALAFAGLVGLLWPGLAAPPLVGSALMLAAGVAWGIYSLQGRGAGDPTRVTAGNFVRAVPMAIACSLFALPWLSIDVAGVGYAMASGALASGLGYAVWYAVLRHLNATRASVVQLSVPVIAAFAGVMLLGEAPTLRLVASSVAVLGGVAVVILAGQWSSARQQ